jgi:hypothetical protein
VRSIRKSERERKFNKYLNLSIQFQCGATNSHENEESKMLGKNYIRNREREEMLILQKMRGNRTN